MTKPQVISTEDIQISIEELEQQLNGVVPNYSKITAEELIDYFDGPAPSGDTMTLNDILDNRCLLAHELIELSELKNMGLNISIKLLRTQPVEVDLEHIIAMGYELEFAQDSGGHDWVERRVQGIQQWLEEGPPTEQIKRKCELIVSKFPII